MIFMENGAICGVKRQDLMGSNFYVSNDFAKDSMEMLSECRFHNSINGF